jgi:hypothetical protein
MNPISPPRGTGRARLRPALAAAAGGLVALASFEIGLRPLALRVEYPPGQVRQYFESEADKPLVEYRQYREGVSVSRFHPDGARVTGNEPLDGATVGLVLGDSNMRAIPVDDAEIAASVLERTARAGGVPLAVREYGFSGAAAPTYVAVAPGLLGDWDPAWVAVVLDPGDLNDAPLALTSGWRMAIRPDLSIDLVRVPPAEKSPLRRRADTWVNRSTLARLLEGRTADVVREALRPADPADADLVQAPASDDATLVPRASVRALKQAYGDRLIVVYTPYVPVSGDAPDDTERALVEACAAEGVECVSTRAAFLDARDREGRFARGFSNTHADFGHLNAVGHRIVAEAIWGAVSRRPPRGRE